MGLSDSSDDGDDESGSGSDSSMEEDEAQLLKAEAAIPIKKLSGDDSKKEDPTAKISGKLKDAKVKKPELMSTKQNVEFSPKRPRGATPTFGITEFGSTSTKERSKISVEKRNDIVKPNISPNKQGNSTSSNDSPPVSASVTPKTTPPTTSVNATSIKADEKKPEGQEPKVNILQAKKKPSAGTMTTTSGTEPPVTIIKVKKKPGPSSSPPKQQSQPASPTATGK